MKFRKYKSLNLPSEEGYLHLLQIQQYLNQQLMELFESNMSKGREVLGGLLIKKCEDLVDQLNESGYRLCRCDYDGDINYENSGQSYCNKSLDVTFRGFSAQVTWDKW